MDSSREFSVIKYKYSKAGSPLALDTDQVAVEEPLEIRLRKNGSPSVHRIAVTMRTPDDNPEHDLELALGFLFGEGIIRSRSEIVGHRLEKNQVEIELRTTLDADTIRRYERSFFVSSSCGVCGKSSIEAVWETTRGCDRTGPGTGPFVKAQGILSLPERLRAAQLAFARTGGLHGAGLFSTQGELLCAREDVGRHNALDKVIGYALLQDSARLRLPLENSLLALSGRISFELMQKAAMAGIRVIVAVGAPSSLAVELAQELDLTLIGFVREGRLNIYHGEWRIHED
jgi:FdhD protein